MQSAAVQPATTASTTGVQGADGALVPSTGRQTFRLLGANGPSLLESLVPGIRPWQQALAAAAFIGLVAGLARVRFYLPDNPVPITLQTFGILLTGGILGWRWGLVSVVGYYLLGMAGVPVFQGGGNGWHYVTATVTAGYLLGFILAVIIAVLAYRVHSLDKSGAVAATAIYRGFRRRNQRGQGKCHAQTPQQGSGHDRGQPGGGWSRV